MFVTELDDGDAGLDGRRHEVTEVPSRREIGVGGEVESEAGGVHLKSC
jgi:hypothetical protein